MSEHLEVRDLLGPYVMGALGAEEQREVEEHLAECAPCREETRDLSVAHERLADLASAMETPPQELKSRVLTGLPRRETSRIPLVAAAAILCVLAVLGVLFSSEIFGRDEVASATLEPTDLAPRAGGELQVHRDDPNAQAELEVWGLPRPGKDEYYELWFGEEGGRVSAGTFTVGAEGTETLYMSVPQEASDYQQVGITLEKFPREPRMGSAKVVLGGELEES
ncbi:MAG TPA: anti-sigma factor [Rubrobacteraceae bacterium]|nr:anti-sigma factor [Rubrobacteraceae bacterium]